MVVGGRAYNESACVREAESCMLGFEEKSSIDLNYIFMNHLMEFLKLFKCIAFSGPKEDTSPQVRVLFTCLLDNYISYRKLIVIRAIEEREEFFIRLPWLPLVVVIVSLFIDLTQVNLL